MCKSSLDQGDSRGDEENNLKVIQKLEFIEFGVGLDVVGRGEENMK